MYSMFSTKCFRKQINFKLFCKRIFFFKSSIRGGLFVLNRSKQLFVCSTAEAKVFTFSQLNFCYRISCSPWLSSIRGPCSPPTSGTRSKLRTFSGQAFCTTNPVKQFSLAGQECCTTNPLKHFLSQVRSMLRSFHNFW